MQDNKRPQENERTVRDALHSRAFKNGAYASGLCAVMLALVVALNLFVGALPAKYLRYDMTENKLYSLSQETEDLCAALTQDVTFYYLGRTGQEDAAVTELLDKYKDASSHIQVVQKDPVLYPTFGAAYDAADAAVGSIIAVCGERYRVVDAGPRHPHHRHERERNRCAGGLHPRGAASGLYMLYHTHAARAAYGNRRRARDALCLQRCAGYGFYGTPV